MAPSIRGRLLAGGRCLPVRPGSDILGLVQAHSSTRTRVSFDSEGAACAGHVYLPGDARGEVPCVVMANGFSGTMDWILPSFAERFAAAGFAVLISPRYIQVYGRAGEAFFTDPSLAGRFRTVEANSPTWENRVAPRFLFGAPRYREGTMERIGVPLLISLASKDVEVSSAFVKEKASKAPRAEIKEYPADHFEMYHGATFEQVVAGQIDFLRKHLLDGAA